MRPPAYRDAGGAPVRFLFTRPSEFDWEQYREQKRSHYVAPADFSVRDDHCDGNYEDCLRRLNRSCSSLACVSGFGLFYHWRDPCPT